MRHSPAAKVLVVDDDEVWLTKIQSSLERDGILVACARSPEEAIEHLRHEHYDIILLDWVLGDQEASTVMPSIRKEAKGTPVWIVTGRDRGSVEKEARTTGARGLITKGAGLGLDIGFRLLSIIADLKRSGMQSNLDGLEEMGSRLSDAPTKRNG